MGWTPEMEYGVVFDRDGQAGKSVSAVLMPGSALPCPIAVRVESEQMAETVFLSPEEAREMATWLAAAADHCQRR